ncbi:MAG: OstA family protein [Chitinophagales bacterium]|nr:OstA family protein [Chitinophagales bacterium]
MRRSILFLGILLIAGFISQPVTAQVLTSDEGPVSTPGGDTLTDVEILGARHLTIQKANDSTTLQILAGNVRLKQGNSLFFCDSCVINNNTKIFEAWGKVHIKDADTADVYSNHLRYLIDKKLAYLDGAVKLTDGKGTLTTPDLEYDMSTNIGIYTHGGRVVNGKTVLTSREGFYYADLRDVYFKKNVELVDPAYFIKTDSLLYNTESKTTRFISQTFIKDSSGRTVETKEGYYNVGTGKAEFGNNPIVRDGPRIYKARRMAFDDSAGTSQLLGNAIVVDTAEGTTIIAGEINSDNKKDRIMATRKPLMIVKQENDSIYIAADTLFSARLSDLPRPKKDPVAKKDSIVQDSLDNGEIVITDSLTKDKPLTDTIAEVKIVKDTITDVKVVSVDDKPDSTFRYFEAFRNVRIFSDSMQAVCDSMFYSFKDSVFRLYQNPILWAKESQVTGDTVIVYTKNKKADYVQVFENSFLINQMDPDIFNQVKSTRMDAYFVDGSIDSVRAAGLAECIYFIQDEDSAYTGINESQCDVMDIYFEKDELEKVVFRSQVTGTIWPIRQKSPSEMRLPNFNWLDEKRPKTKYELYE